MRDGHSILPDVLDFTVEWILREEGGVADVGDGMGLTRWGQTAGWLDRWGLPVPSTRGEAKANYLAWMGLSGLDQLCDINDMLSTVVADYAINSGESPAIKTLQLAVGAHPDGVIGPETLAALNHTPSRHVITHQILARRVEHLGEIISAHRQRALYAKGWMRRIGRQLRRLGRE